MYISLRFSVEKNNVDKEEFAYSYPAASDRRNGLPSTARPDDSTRAIAHFWLGFLANISTMPHAGCFARIFGSSRLVSYTHLVSASNAPFSVFRALMPTTKSADQPPETESYPHAS
jgi:hypothetical protein